MTARTTRRTRLPAAVTTTAGALALALLPTTAAHAAAPSDPQFAYMAKIGAAGDRVVFSNGAAGDTAAPNPASATALTPTSGMQAYSFDVSYDGTSWVACLGAGTAAGSDYDRAYGLVLTHTDGTHTVSKLLSNFCEGNPVMSPDGLTVYWYTEDKIAKFSATYDTATAAITGSTSVMSTGQFLVGRVAGSTQRTEYVAGLAVSPDGANAAVMFMNLPGASVHARVRASAMSAASSKPVFFQSQYTNTAAAYPQNDSTIFVDNTTVLWGMTTSRTTDGPLFTSVKTVIPTAANSTTTAAVPTLDGTYGLRPYVDPATPAAAPTWYVWKDVYDVITDPLKPKFDHSEFGSTSDWATVSPIVWQARADGASTFHYRPVSATPPTLVDVTAKAAPHASFTVAATFVTYGKAVAFPTCYNLYDVNPLSGAYSAANAAEVDRGRLEMSVNGGASWTVVRTTSGASAFISGGKWYSGTSPVLRRTTVLRWTYLGSAFASAAAPIARRVVVVPVVTVRAAISGSSRIVTGTATRPSGAVYLQRLVKGKWAAYLRVGLVKIGTYTGKFAFAKRVLPRGTYRVLTLSDAYAAAGAKAFKV